MLEPVCEYAMPYEREVGLHPSLEEMHDVVVTRRLRPQLPVHSTDDTVGHQQYAAVKHRAEPHVLYCLQLNFNLLFTADVAISLQCFDAVGWVAGRASGL